MATGEPAERTAITGAASNDPDGPLGGPARDFARRTGLVSLATALSRVLGLAREQLFAFTLGASPQAEAFLIAYRIPNLLRDLFAEGALSAAFVPAYARASVESRERAFALARRVLTLLALVLGVISICLAWAAPEVVSLLAGGFAGSPEKSSLAVRLTRVMLPILPLVSFAAVAMGILNSRDRFGLPSLAPAMFNVVNIVVALALVGAGAGVEAAAWGWALGAVLGSFFQWAIQWPGLRSEGFRFEWDHRFRDPLIGDIGRTMLPATLGLAAVQINLFVTSNFASFTPAAVAWLNYAFRVLYLPMGLFGVAVGVVASARLAKQLAARQIDEAHRQVVEALRLLIFLTLPSAAGLFVAARPIIRLLYERGRFEVADTESTAEALALMAIGLVAYASTKVLVPFFYASGRTGVPLIATGVAVASNLSVILLTGPALGFHAAAIGMAAGNLANGGVLAAAYSRSVRSLADRSMGLHLLRVCAASALMAGAVLSLIPPLERAFGTSGIEAQALTALLPIGAGVLVYGLAAHALGVREASTVGGRVGRFVFRSASKA